MATGISLLCFICMWLGAQATVQDYPFTDPHCEPGREGIVHLFEWTWTSIARECELFLGPYGYCGLQTSPASEHEVLYEPFRPWYENYGPVSYKIASRQGSEQEFRDMVRTCNDHGVRVYVDVVLNHMAAIDKSGYGSGGTFYNSTQRYFPGVPYDREDFTNHIICPTDDLACHNFSDVIQVRNCRYGGLPDLVQRHEHVRGLMTSFLNRLIDHGVAGFRVDMARGMWPQDLKVIFDRTKDVQQGGRPFIYQEIIDYGNDVIKGEEYFASGRITNFRCSKNLALNFLKYEKLISLEKWGPDYDMWDGFRVVNFVDNHDNQRGHGTAGPWLTHWEPRPYKLATAFMLAHPYGFPRIMSSYEYDRCHDVKGDQGPPMNPDQSIQEVQYDGLKCLGNWTCEHRWRVMRTMVNFRRVVAGTGVDNWWSGSDFQIAFSRGNKGFIVINLDNKDVDVDIQTGMPPGEYCDVITGDIRGGVCTGRQLTVRQDGTCRLVVGADWDEPLIAFHIDSRLHKVGQALANGHAANYRTSQGSREPFMRVVL